MQSRTLTVTNPTGLHARPAALLVQTANKFESQVTVYKSDGTGRKANAKSILTVLSLGASKNTSVTIETSGVDELEALQALVALVASFKE